MTYASSLLLLASLSFGSLVIVNSEFIPYKQGVQVIGDFDNPCELCEYLVNYFQKLLKDPDNVDYLIKLFEASCEGLPKPLDQVCDLSVTHFAKEYIDKFINSTAHQVCTDFKLCNGHTNSGNIRQKFKCTPDGVCELFTFIVSFKPNELFEKYYF